MAQATRNPEVRVPKSQEPAIWGPTADATRAAPLRNSSLTESAVSTPTIGDLLRRMQAGDRAAAAAFLMRYESRLRRRIRGKLGPDVRRLFDSLDIVSTLGRRLDLYVMSGQLEVRSESECISLLFKMADRALIDKARMFRQLESLEGEDSEFAHRLATRLRAAERRSHTAVDVEIEKCMRALEDPLDRRILSLWLTGERPAVIGEYVQLSHTAVRKRWLAIKSALRDHLPPT